MPITPVTCPKQPLTRDLDVEVFISRPQTELATDMTMIALLTPGVTWSDGGNDRVRYYSTLDSLASDVGVNSAAYWAGAAFFARSERPSKMCVARVFEDPTSATLRGGALTPSRLQSITSGGFDIVVDGESRRVRGLNFAGATTGAQVASVVSAALSGVIVSYDAARDGLVLATTMQGDGAALGYAESPSAASYQVATLQASGSVDTLAAVDGVANGSLAVIHNGTEYAVTGMDFSGARTPAAVAEIIEAALVAGGLYGLHVYAGDDTLIFALEGETGAGFAASPVSLAGVDLGPRLQLTAAYRPVLRNYLEAAASVPAKLTGGGGLDYGAAGIAKLGTTTLRIGGTPHTVDLSGVTSAETLQTALRASATLSALYIITVTASGITLTATDSTGYITYAANDETGSALKLSASTATDLQPVSVPAYATTDAQDVSSLLALTESLASSNTVGYTPGGLVSEAAIVAAAARCDGNAIYGWILDAQYRDTQDQKAFADWIESRDPAIFVACTNSPQAYNSADSGNIGAYCSQRGYRRTATIYHNNPQVYPDMSYLACALSVNYAQSDSAITLKFKQLTGIEPSPLTLTQLEILQSRNINAYVFIGNTAREVREGTQALDTWYTDSLVNLDNFREELQVEVYNVFLRSKKVPYTAAGQNMLVSAAAKICARYKRNGVFADRDEESLENETGFVTHPATNIQPAPVTGATASDRAQRLAPPIAITAYEAGAFHKVTLNISVFN